MTELSADAPRQKTFLLAAPEARVLTWIAERLPARVLPDHLTAIGVLAALAVAVTYVLANEANGWLIAGAALLVVQWLGDSLDGTLARTRKIERPRYGYYLDHLVDAISTALIGIGLGLSPHLLLSTGLLIVVVYLVMSINTYLETSVFGVFELGYGRFGPTEARLALIAMNVAMALGAGMGFQFLGVGITVLDVVAWVVAGGMLAALGFRAAKNLRTLAAAEPPATPRIA
jgi:archaetidylinositol phosphate synthase